MCRSDAKAGVSDPTIGRRTVEAQEIKATPGITGWYCPSVNWALIKSAYNGETVLILVTKPCGVAPLNMLKLT